MKKIVDFFTYAAKCFYDPKGIADAINEVQSPAELDNIILGRKNGSPAHLREQGAAE